MPAFAENTILIDSNETNLTEFSSGYFIDANNLSFNEIKQARFIDGGSCYSLGTNAKNTWVKVGLKNNTSHAQKLYLHMPEAFHNKQVAFYETSSNGKLLNQAIIDLNHAQDSPYIFQGSAIYEFGLSPQEIKHIYIQSVSFSHQWFTLKILDENHSKRVLANTYNYIFF